MSAPPPAAAPSRLRPRAVLLIGFAGALVVGGVALRTPVPLLAAIPLLTVALAATWGSRGGTRSTDLTWEAGGLGPSLEIRGRLSGPFARGGEGIDVVVPPVPGATPRGPTRVVRSPEEILFSVDQTLAEPVISVLAPPRVVRHDPLGLAEGPIPGARPTLAVERYPPELTRLGSVRLDRTLHLPGESRSHRIGTSGEFFGVRVAAPGEPPRRINWRASARVGQLLANDYQLDRTGDILLLLDVRPTRFGRDVDERLLAISRAGLYGIAESFLRTKVRVGYARFGEFLEAIPLSTGRVHRIRVKQAVLESRRSEVAGPAERCAFQLRRYFRPGLTTLVISQATGDPGFDLLPYLSRGGFPSILVSPSPLGLRGSREEGSEPSVEEALARRLENAERRSRVAGSWEYGPVIDWTDYWSLAALERFLRQPTRRRVS